MEGFVTTEDYYLALGVPPFASPSLIHDAYKFLSSRFDFGLYKRYRDSKAGRLIETAYDTLKDERKRMEYDLIYTSVKDQNASMQIAHESESTSCCCQWRHRARNLEMSEFQCQCSYISTETEGILQNDVSLIAELQELKSRYQMRLYHLHGGKVYFISSSIDQREQLAQIPLRIKTPDMDIETDSRGDQSRSLPLKWKISFLTVATGMIFGAEVVVFIVLLLTVGVIICIIPFALLSKAESFDYEMNPAGGGLYAAIWIVDNRLLMIERRMDKTLQEEMWKWSSADYEQKIRCLVESEGNRIQYGAEKRKEATINNDRERQRIANIRKIPRFNEPADALQIQQDMEPGLYVLRHQQSMEEQVAERRREIQQNTVLQYSEWQNDAEVSGSSFYSHNAWWSEFEGRQACPKCYEV